MTAATDLDIMTTVTAADCGEAAAKVVHKHMGRVSGPHAMAHVAYVGAGAVIGTALGAHLALLEEISDSPFSDVEVVDSLFELFKPMALRSVARLREAEIG